MAVGHIDPDVAQILDTAAALIGVAHKHTDFVAPALDAHDFLSVDAVADLEGDLLEGESETLGERGELEAKFALAGSEVIFDIVDPCVSCEAFFDEVGGDAELFVVDRRDIDLDRASDRAECCGGKGKAGGALDLPGFFSPEVGDGETGDGSAFASKKFDGDLADFFTCWRGKALSLCGISSHPFGGMEDQIGFVLFLELFVESNRGLFDVIGDFACAFERSSRGHDEAGNETVRIDAWEEDEFDEATAHQTKGHKQQSDGKSHNGPTMDESEAQRDGVEFGVDPIEAVVECFADTVILVLDAVDRLECVGKVGRKDEDRFNEADKEGDDDDGRDHVDELAREAADDEQRGKGHHGGGDGSKDRRNDFDGAVDGGLDGGFALFEMGIDVFGDHDGVVDKDADDKDQTKEADGVDGEAAKEHDDHTAEHGDRESSGDPKGKAEVHQKRECEENKDQTLDAVFDQKFETVTQDDGGVVDKGELDTGREDFFGFFDIGFSDGSDHKGVFACDAFDVDQYGAFSAKRVRLWVVFKGFTGLGNITHEDRCGSGSGADNDIFEFFGEIAFSISAQDQVFVAGAQRSARDIEVGT